MAWLVAGCLLVVVIQIVVAWAGDTRAFSGSDAGGRAASIAAASDAGGCDHDLGYWAAEWDPAGRAHPMVNSIATEDGYIQPTSIPYVCAASAAAAIGLSWALWISIAGVVLAGVGAALLERAAGGTGLWSFILVGVVGPIAFYGTDTWEHAPAAGAAIAGTALFLTTRSTTAAVVGGLLWGLAISMRSETAIVAAGLMIGGLAVGEVRTRLLSQRSRLTAFAVAGVAVLLLDRLAQEDVAGSDYRGARVSSQAGDVGLDLAERGRDALLTTVALIPTNPPSSGVLIGAAFVLCLIVIGAHVVGSMISRSIAHAAIIGMIALVAIRVVDPGFVPGVLAAAPFAALGLFAVRTGAPPIARSLAIAAVVALPAVWALQWRGNLGPQWGGRYALVSGAFLVVCGVTVARPRWNTLPVRAVVAVSLVLGLSGLAWHVERTKTFAGAAEDILELPCDEVLISTSTYLLREGGSFPELRAGMRDDGCRMLNGGDGRLELALQIAKDSGAESVTLLAAGRIERDPESLSSTVIVDREIVELAGSAHTLLFLTI